MTWWVTTAAAATGVLTAGWVRGQVFIHSVPPGPPRRTVCPHCHRVPFKAWRAAVWLPGSRCGSCRQRVGAPLGTVEAITAGGCGLLGATQHDWLVLAAFLPVAVAGTGLALIDLAVRRLPNRLTLPIFAIALTLLAIDAAWQHRPAAIAAALAGAATSTGIYLLLALIAGGGVGDAKLALSTGTVLGWHGWTTALFGVMASLALTSLFALALVLTGRRKRGDHIAHGPAMLAAALTLATIAPP